MQAKTRAKKQYGLADSWRKMATDLNDRLRLYREKQPEEQQSPAVDLTGGTDGAANATAACDEAATAGEKRFKTPPPQRPRGDAEAEANKTTGSPPRVKRRTATEAFEVLVQPNWQPGQPCTIVSPTGVHLSVVLPNDVHIGQTIQLLGVCESGEIATDQNRIVSVIKITTPCIWRGLWGTWRLKTQQYRTPQGSGGMAGQSALGVCTYQAGGGGGAREAAGGRRRPPN